MLIKKVVQNKIKTNKDLKQHFPTFSHNFYSLHSFLILSFSQMLNIIYEKTLFIVKNAQTRYFQRFPTLLDKCDELIQRFVDEVNIY